MKRKKERKGKERKGKERKGREREAMHKNSQKCYISRSHGGGTPGAISMKFGPLVHKVNVINSNSAKFDHCSSNGLDLARVYYKIYRFPMLNPTAHTTGRALTRFI
jgi:hypothetical protein